jgi:hypothetical protein
MDKNRLFQLELKCKQFQKNRSLNLIDRLKDASKIDIKWLKNFIERLKKPSFSFSFSFPKIRWKLVIAITTLTIATIFLYRNMDQIEFSDINISKYSFDINFSYFKEYIPFFDFNTSDDKQIDAIYEFNTTELPKEITIEYSKESSLKRKEIEDILDVDKDINFQNYILLDYREYRDNSEEISAFEIVDELESSPPEKIVYILDVPMKNREIVDDWGELHEFSIFEEKREVEVNLLKNQSNEKNYSFEKSSLPVEFVEFVEFVEKVEIIKPTLPNATLSAIDENNSYEKSIDENLTISEDDLWDELYIFDSSLDEEKSLWISPESLNRVEVIDEKVDEVVEIPKNIEIPDNREIIINEKLPSNEPPPNPLEELIAYDFGLISSEKIVVNEKIEKNEKKDGNIEEIFLENRSFDIGNFQLFENAPKIGNIVFSEDLTKKIEKNIEKNSSGKVPFFEVPNPNLNIANNSIPEIPDINRSWENFKLFANVSSEKVISENEKEEEEIKEKEKNISFETERVPLVSSSTKHEGVGDFGVMDNLLIEKTEEKPETKPIEIEKPEENIRREKPSGDIKPAEVIELKREDKTLEREIKNRYNTIFLSPTVNLR